MRKRTFLEGWRWRLHFRRDIEFDSEKGRLRLLLIRQFARYRCWKVIVREISGPAAKSALTSLVHGETGGEDGGESIYRRSLGLLALFAGRGGQPRLSEKKLDVEREHDSGRHRQAMEVESSARKV
jgi:hypothetical protein